MTSYAGEMVQKFEKRKGFLACLIKIFEWFLIGIRRVMQPFMYIAEKLSRFLNLLENFVPKHIIGADKLPIKIQ